MDPQLVQTVKSIAELLKTHSWPQGVVEWGQFALVFLTLATLGVLIWYSFETKRLRVATQELLSETRRQNQKHTMPVVTLEYDLFNKGHGEYRKFVIRNLGSGPAFNVVIAPFQLNGATYSFRHPLSIAGNEQEVVTVVAVRGKVTSEIRKVADFEGLLLQHGPFLSHPLKIVYFGMDGNAYQTDHTLRLAADNKLQVVFANRQRVPVVAASASFLGTYPQ